MDRQEARADFLRSGREAWEDDQATGKYISAQAADAWLARLEAGEDFEPPKPE